MQRIEDLQAPPGRRTAVTIGVFDGLHLGHQGVLLELVARAREERLLPLVLTFSTHPDRLVSHRAPAPLITTEHRLRLMARLGLEAAIVLPFDHTLREMGAAAFAREVLRARLDAGLLVMGYDSALGRDREGDFPTMERLGREEGFRTLSSPPLLWQGRPISSSHIRQALREGDLALVWGLLGRPFSLLGKVIRGRGEGRRLGFPTANLDPGECLMPPAGVYAASARVGGDHLPAVLNLGRSPTFGGRRLLVETHLLDYGGDPLHGREMEVFFHRAIRSERRFSSAGELARQIARDVQSCREILGDSPLSDY